MSSLPYRLPRGGRNQAAGVMWGTVGIALLCVVGSAWLTTQWAAWRLGYADALGEPWLGQRTAPSTARIDGPRRGECAIARRAKRKMEPTIRLERTTCSLRVSCSTS